MAGSLRSREPSNRLVFEDRLDMIRIPERSDAGSGGLDEYHPEGVRLGRQATPPTRSSSSSISPSAERAASMTASIVVWREPTRERPLACLVEPGSSTTMA